MGASFNGSSDKLGIASGLGITGTTFTIAAWFTTNQLTADRAMAGLITAGGDNDGTWLSFAGAVAGDPVQTGAVNQGVSSSSANSGSTSASTSVWYHAMARFSGGSFLAIFNGLGGSGASPPAISNPTQIDFGWAGVLGTYHNGNLAAMAMWTASLTDDEVASLAKGFPPRRVRPQSLVCDIPALRDVIQRKSASAGLTVTGTAVVVHPRMYGF